MPKLSIEKYKNDKFYPKVVKAISHILKTEDVISPVKVILQMGNVSKNDYDAWRNGKIRCFERVLQGSLSKANRILRIIEYHAHDLNMVSFQHKYLRKGKIPLRFSKSGEENLEKAYSRHYKWNQSQEKKQELIKTLSSETDRKL